MTPVGGFDGSLSRSLIFTGVRVHSYTTVHETVVLPYVTIGRNVRLYQAVTLGAKRFATDDDGHLQKGGARHPKLEDEVVVYAGATILGRVTIGSGSVIGGNVWLTRSVPPGSHVSQARTRDDSVFGGGI